MMAPSISVFLIDAHPIVRRGVAATLADAFPRIATTGAGNFTDARQHLQTRHTHLVISEFRIDGQTVLPLLASAGVAGLPPRFLIYSALDETRCGVPAIRGGASGFVPKSAPLSDLAAAVRSLLAGRPWLSESLAHALASPDNGAPLASRHLSRRELEIFSLLGQGLTVSQIASRLTLAVKTIESHREHIKTKLQLRTATQVTAAAARWIDDPATQI